MAKFVVIDVFGERVECSELQWNDHIVRRHPEMGGREDAVMNAIRSPVSVFGGNLPDTKAFLGEKFTTGFWTGATPIAVVRYHKASGFVVTAYLGTPSPDRRIIWARS